MKEKKLKILVEECKNGDKEAREKLIDYYIPYAKRIAKEYYGLGVEDEDVLMAAYEGLIIAMNKIEEHHYSNLTALINTHIELSIKREIVRNISTLGVPKETMANILIKLKQLREKITQEEITRILTDRQQNALKKEINVERLDETFMTYEKLDSINYGNIDIEHLVIHQELLKELESIILKSRLNGIEKEVILHKYIFADLTSTEIASKNKVSSTYVNYCAHSSIRKLKKYYLKYFIQLADSKDRSERVNVRGLANKRK